MKRIVDRIWLSRRWVSASILFIALSTLLGCAGIVQYNVPAAPPMGALFISAKGPLTTNVNGNPTGNEIKKVSHSQTGYFRDFILTGLDFAWDDVSIRKIAREGGIEHISYADYEMMNVLGIYATFTITVYGY